MYSSLAVNKYLHTVASVGFLFTFNYEARNHELKERICVTAVPQARLPQHSVGVWDRFPAGSGTLVFVTATRPAQKSTVTYKIGNRKKFTRDKEVKM